MQFHHKAALTPAIDVADVDLRCECVLCGAMLTEADYRAQRVVAIIDQGKAIGACASHVEAGPEECARVTLALAKEVAKRLKERGR